MSRERGDSVAADIEAVTSPDTIDAKDRAYYDTDNIVVDVEDVKDEQQPDGEINDDHKYAERKASRFRGAIGIVF